MRPLSGVDVSPVGVHIDPVLHGPAQPVDVQRGKALLSKIDPPLLLGPLPPAVAPDKGRVLPAVVRKAIISRDAGVGPLERADLEGDIAGHHPLGPPLLDDLNVQRFFPSVVVLPQIGHRLRNFPGPVGREGLLSRRG